MKRVLGIGNALFDVMATLNDNDMLEFFSLPKGSMQLIDREKSDQIKAHIKNSIKILSAGGSAANTIYGLSVLGVDTGFIGSIGKDEAGDLFEKDLQKAGVKTMLLRRESATGTAIALITPDSERTFATHLGAAVELDSKDIDRLFFKGYDILYLEGYLINNLPLVETACNMAGEEKMKIVIDLSSYNVVKENLPGFEKIIRDYAHIVFTNEDEASAFTGMSPEKALDCLSKYCEIAIVKTGSKGSLIKKNEQTIRIGTLPVQCVDTTGAGDLYAAGFLYGYSRDLDLETCGVLGALMAGKVIETIGARIDNKTWAGIKKKIEGIIRKNE